MGFQLFINCLFNIYMYETEHYDCGYIKKPLNDHENSIFTVSTACKQNKVHLQKIKY